MAARGLDFGGYMRHEDSQKQADKIGGVLHRYAVREEPELGLADEIVVDLRSGEEVGR